MNKLCQSYKKKFPQLARARMSLKKKSSASANAGVNLVAGDCKTSWKAMLRVLTHKLIQTCLATNQVVGGS